MCLTHNVVLCWRRDLTSNSLTTLTGLSFPSSLQQLCVCTVQWLVELSGESLTVSVCVAGRWISMRSQRQAPVISLLRFSICTYSERLFMTQASYLPVACCSVAGCARTRSRRSPASSSRPNCSRCTSMATPNSPRCRAPFFRTRSPICTQLQHPFVLSVSLTVSIIYYVENAATAP